jgi:hypothetical protein
MVRRTISSAFGGPLLTQRMTDELM